MKTTISLTTASGADRAYFGYLAEGRFLIPQCNDCAKFHFFPRIVCPHCGSISLKWSAPSGKGTVYSTTTVRRTEGDYNVCLIDLHEGPRMMSRVVDANPSTICIGMRVSAKIIAEQTGPLVVFSPDEAQG